MGTPIKPSLENIGIWVAVISAISAAIGWVYKMARNFVVGIVQEGIREHREANASAIIAAETGLAVLEERTDTIMAGLAEVRDDIKVLIKMSGHNCGNGCPFLDRAIEESHERN